MSRLLAQIDADGNLGEFRGPTTAFQPDPNAVEITSAGTVLQQFLSNFIGVLTIIAGLAFLLFFVFGGLQWILAGGDQGRIDAAKKQMTNGAIGLVIVIVAYGVVALIGQVVGLDILNPLQELEKLDPRSSQQQLFDAFAI